MADYDLSITQTTDAQTIYAVLRRISDAYAWHTGSESWVAYVAGDWDHYAINLPSLGGGLYGAVMPDAIGTGIKITIRYYEQAGATPVRADDLGLGGWTGRWTGSAEAEEGTGVSADAWVTLSAVKAYPGFPESLSDTQVATLINGVTAAIIKWLKRPILSEARAEWLDGRDSKYVWLDLRPVTEIRRVATCREQAATLCFNGTRTEGYSTARFQITSTELKLSYTSMGVVHTTAITLADCLMLEDLEAAVEAVSLWTMELGGDMDYIPTAELQPTEWTFALSNNSPVYIPGEELTDYRNDGEAGMVYRADGERFARSTRNVYVDYTGGWELDGVPPDITQATYETCLWAAQVILRDTSLLSHRLGDEAWTRAAGPTGISELHAMLASKLSAYRVPTI